MEGKVKWFNDKFGYGFITDSDGTDIFVHYHNIKNFPILKEGEKVIFDVVPGNHRHPIAINVTKEEFKMNDNYIMLNGKRIELTDEQIEKLGLRVEASFNRAEEYYYISDCGITIHDFDHKTFDVEDKRYNTANYCTDKSLMEQRALHETLSRLLWRYSMQHDGELIDWNVASDHCKDKYCITYNHYNQRFEVFEMAYNKLDGNFFYTKATALKAIDDIIKPFMQEHPEFIW